MNGHPQFDEDFDLYAMGALEGEEKLALESHLRQCAECAAKLEEASSRMALLALAAPSEAAPSVVKERLLRQIPPTPLECKRAALLPSCAGWPRPLLWRRWHCWLWRLN